MVGSMALNGSLIRLREIREEDLPLLVELRNDLDTQAWSRTLPPDFTSEMLRKKHLDREFSFRPGTAQFTIELLETGEAVGNANYSGVQDRMEATLGIMVAKPWWGTGVAREANELLLEFLFEEMGMRVVRLWTQSGNDRALGAARQLGFREAARIPGGIYKGGVYVDNVMMDLLREEWYELHPELTDNLDDPLLA